MQGITAIAKILKMEGVEFISGFPMNAILEAGAKEGIRTIMSRNERVVGMADAFTRASFGRRIGVCAMQGNPGVENAYSGVAQAFSENVPILVLPTGPARRRLLPPNYISSKSFRDITKYTEMISFADQVPEVMRRAFTMLKLGKPVLCLSRYRMMLPSKNSTMPNSITPRCWMSGRRETLHDIKDVAKALIDAKNLVIRAGMGVLWGRATDELIELAELLQAPVFSTLASKSVFPENHPLAFGAGGRTRPKMVMDFLKKADLVFAIGSSCTKEGFTTAIPDGKRIIQATIDERDIAKDYPLEHAIIGDAKLVMRQLIDEVKTQLGSNGRKGQTAVAGEIKTIKTPG